MACELPFSSPFSLQVETTSRRALFALKCVEDSCNRKSLEGRNEHEFRCLVGGRRGCNRDRCGHRVVRSPPLGCPALERPTGNAELARNAGSSCHRPDQSLDAIRYAAAWPGPAGLAKRRGLVRKARERCANCDGAAAPSLQ